MPKTQLHIGRRCVAGALDQLVVWALGTGLGLLLLPSDEPPSVPTFLLFFRLTVLLWVLYMPVCEASFGRTLGKGLFDLKVIKVDGSPLTFIDTLKRHVLDSIELNGNVLVGILVLRFSSTGQRLGDMWGRTRVIYAPYRPPR